MSKLFLPETNYQTTNFKEIQSFLRKKGVSFERWDAEFPLKDSDDQETILKAYERDLKPFMEKQGYHSADVINVHPQTPNLKELRDKFIKEHVHSEDEIRFFVDGSGIFWFHFDDRTVASITCEKGDFLAVPQGFRHWFDLAPNYFVKAIRIFSNKEGWIAHYTDSGVDALYADL